MNYRIFHYFGSFYQEPSNGENLPYDIKTIKKNNDNSFSVTYVDNSNYLNLTGSIDTLIFYTFPNIKIEFSNDNLTNFQKSKDYIKLTDEILEGISVPIPTNSLPQDVTEFYLTEIITKLLNIKFKTNFKTREIFESLHKYYIFNNNSKNDLLYTYNYHLIQEKFLIKRALQWNLYSYYYYWASL